MANTGRLNQNIRFVRFEDTDDGAGGSYPVESTYWETSAEVKEIKAVKDLMALQEVLKSMISITVRYRDDKSIISDMQLYWRGQLFTVVRVEVDYIYKRFITVIAKASEMPDR